MFDIFPNLYFFGQSDTNIRRTPIERSNGYVGTVSRAT